MPKELHLSMSGPGLRQAAGYHTWKSATLLNYFFSLRSILRDLNATNEDRYWLNAYLTKEVDKE